MNDCAQAVVEVRVKDTSLPDAGAAPAAPEDTTGSDKAKPKKVKKKFDNTVPKAILEFHDVSNDADGDYEVIPVGVCFLLSPWWLDAVWCTMAGIVSLGETCTH